MERERLDFAPLGNSHLLSYTHKQIHKAASAHTHAFVRNLGWWHQCFQRTGRDANGRHTNKCLFSIPHSTSLQRVRFPGSLALLMQPSLQSARPQSAAEEEEERPQQHSTTMQQTCTEQRDRMRVQLHFYPTNVTLKACNASRARWITRKTTEFEQSRRKWGHMSLVGRRGRKLDHDSYYQLE